MRTLTLSLVAAFAMGLFLASVTPASAAGDCGWGHSKTADSATSSIAEGQTPQTPKPDQGG